MPNGTVSPIPLSVTEPLLFPIARLRSLLPGVVPFIVPLTVMLPPVVLLETLNAIAFVLSRMTSPFRSILPAGPGLSTLSSPPSVILPGVALISILPPLAPATAVSVLTAPTVTLAPVIVTSLDSAMMLSPSLMEKDPTEFPSESAVKVTEPPGPFKFNSLLLRGLIVISFVACSSMSVPAANPCSSDSYIVVGVPSLATILPAVPLGLPAKVLFPSVALSAVPAAITISTGSSSKVPNCPLVALVSTPPRKIKCCLPETSTKPPSPKFGPPRALISP